LKRNSLWILGLAVLITALTGCGRETGVKVSSVSASAPTVTNIELILDASDSMAEEIQGKAKIDIAKDTLTTFIIDLPDNVNVGLRVYGADAMKDCEDSHLMVPIEPIDKAALIKAIYPIQTGAMTPIAYSLEQAVLDFRGLEGENVVILVSDGAETCEGDPVAAAQKLAESDIKVKTHVIGFDVTRLEREHLQAIAEAGEGDYYGAKDATQLAESFQIIKKEVIEKAEVKPKRKVFTVEGKTFVEQDSFDVRLSSYEVLEDGKIQVNLIHTSKNRNYSLHLALADPGKNTYLIDDSGNQYWYLSSTGIDRYDEKESLKGFPRGVGIKYSITFPKLREEATSFSLVCKYCVYRVQGMVWYGPGWPDVIFTDAKLEK